MPIGNASIHIQIKVSEFIKKLVSFLFCEFNPFSARGPIYRPPLCLRKMREADVSAHFFQALQ